MKSSKLPIAMISIIILALVTIWFFNGKIIASGESAIPFYNSAQLLNIVQFTWTPSALGFVSTFTLASLPVYFITQLLTTFLKNNFLTQAIEYASLLLISGISVIVYLRSSFKNNILAFSAALFYLFNLFVIPNVWGRVQYSYIFFYTTLPLFFYFFIVGIEKRKVIHVLFINLLFCLFSITFTSIPVLELFWLILGFYLLYYIFLNLKQKSKILFAISFLIISFFSWIVINSWWFLQFVKVLTTNTYITGFYTVSADTSTLLALSDRLGNLSYVFRLMHKDYFDAMEAVWGWAYSSFFFIIISYIIPFLAFTPLLVKKKPAIIYFFLGLSLIVIFLVKGAGGPFGGLFLFTFLHIRFLEAFRNPFEKFGIALPFAYTPLIGYSIYALYLYIKQKYGLIKAIISFITIVFTLFGLLVFPMWNRWVFTSNIPPANNVKIGDYVQVPAYYKEANAWLNNDKTDFRNIALPMSGEGITYQWQYGYSGVELSNSLFDKPFISLSTTIQFLPTIAEQVEQVLYQTPGKFSTLLKFLDVKHIMVRSDVDYAYRKMTNPEEISSFLSTNSGTKIQNLQYEKTFGKLDFYKNKEYVSKIYAPQSLIFASDDMPFIDVFELSNIGNSDAISNATVDQQKNKALSDSSHIVLLEPIDILDFSNYPHVSLDDARKQLSYPRFLPGSPFYPLIRLRESLEAGLTTDTDAKFFKDLTLTSKRISELNALLAQGKILRVHGVIEDYIHSLIELESLVDGDGIKVMKDNFYYFRQILIGQKVLLQNIKSQFNQSRGDTQLALDTLQKISVSHGVFTLFDSMQPIIYSDKAVYRFDVPKKGEYVLLLKKDSSKKILIENNKSSIQIDNKIITVQIEEGNNMLDLGKTMLDKGLHEIQIPYNNENILDIQKENAIQTNNFDSKSKSFTFSIVDPKSTYALSFDYWIKTGNQVSIDFNSDVDSRIGNKSIPFWHTGLVTDSYNHAFQNRSYTFTPPANSKKVFISFKIQPFNNCGEINSSNIFYLFECRHNKSFYTSFNKPTLITLKNLKVKKTSPQSLYLRMDQNNIPAFGTPTISYTKINTTDYNVHIEHATKPFFLIFSESYHPLWKLEYADTKKTISEDKHFLANSYANMWYIERQGSYDIDLNFTAQKIYSFGGKISLSALTLTILSLLYIFIDKLRKKIWK